MSALQRLKLSIKYYGFRGTFCRFASRGLNVLRISPRLQHWLWLRMELQYDRKFHVKTTAWFNRNDWLFFEPSSAVNLFLKLQPLDVNFADYTFIDFGSGKGRALFIASEFDFQKIIGVEITEEVYRDAVRNIEMHRNKYQRCRDIQTVCADARTFPLPETPLVIYMFNPFPEPILREVAALLRQSIEQRPRHVLLIYANPLHRAVLDTDPFWHALPSSDPYWAYYEAGVRRSTS